MRQAESGFPICKPCLDVRQNPSRDTHFPSYGRRPLPKPKPKKSRSGDTKSMKNLVIKGVAKKITQ